MTLQFTIHNFSPVDGNVTVSYWEGLTPNEKHTVSLDVPVRDSGKFVEWDALKAHIIRHCPHDAMARRAALKKRPPADHIVAQRERIYDFEAPSAPLPLDIEV